MKISILTPTRGRPDLFERFYKSVLDNVTNHEVIVYGLVDENDTTKDSYTEQFNVRIYTRPEGTVSLGWNYLANRASIDSTDIMIMGNDDVVYRTHGWDKILVDKVTQYPDQIYCAWFEDLINGPTHCAFPIVSAKWYNILGYFAPTCFNFGYNDTWVFDIAQRVGRTLFISEVVAEHMHVTTGKQAPDDTWNRNRNQERGNLYAKDQVIFGVTQEVRQRHADLLKGAIQKEDNHV